MTNDIRFSVHLHRAVEQILAADGKPIPDRTELIKNINPGDCPAARAYAKAYADIDAEQETLWQNTLKTVLDLPQSETPYSPDPGEMYEIMMGIHTWGDSNDLGSNLEARYGGRQGWMVEHAEREIKASTQSKDAWNMLRIELGVAAAKEAARKTTNTQYYTTDGHIVMVVRENNYRWVARYRDETDVKKMGVGVSAKNAATTLITEFAAPGVELGEMVDPVQGENHIHLGRYELLKRNAVHQLDKYYFTMNRTEPVNIETADGQMVDVRTIKHDQLLEYVRGGEKLSDGSFYDYYVIIAAHELFLRGDAPDDLVSILMYAGRGKHAESELGRLYLSHRPTVGRDWDEPPYLHGDVIEEYIQRPYNCHERATKWDLSICEVNAIADLTHNWTEFAREVAHGRWWKDEGYRKFIQQDSETFVDGPGW